jgi:hypothetical protein
LLLLLLCQVQLVRLTARSALCHRSERDSTHSADDV